MIDGLEVKLFLFHFFHVFHDTESEYGIKFFGIFDKVEKFSNTPFVYPCFLYNDHLVATRVWKCVKRHYLKKSVILKKY